MTSTRRLTGGIALLALALSALGPLPSAADGNEALGESFRAVYPGGGVVSAGVGLATRAGGPSSGDIVLADLPAGASVEKAFLYWAILAGDDPQVTFAGGPVTGSLIGRSQETCWWNPFAPDPAHDNRAYRADVTSLVPGNGTYPITDVGAATGNPEGDAHGASLVVTYSSDAEHSTTVIINDGAMTGWPRTFQGQVISHTFYGLEVGYELVSARLHVGMGDASEQHCDDIDCSYADEPMTFTGEPVAPEDFFNGSAGPKWDSHTIEIPVSLLPPGTEQAENAINTRDDCMVWVYAALEISEPPPPPPPPPPIEIAEPPDGMLTNDQRVTFAGTAIEGVYQVRLYDGEDPLTYAFVEDGAWTTDYPFDDGPRTVTAVGVDASGTELSPSRQVSFTVDTAPPQVAITSPRPAGAALLSLPVTGTVDDDVAVGSVGLFWTRIGPGGVDTGTADVVCTGCGTPAAVFEGRIEGGAGAYLVHAEATDMAGNSASSGPVVVVLATG